jgi:endoribonuclease Dicer
MVSNATLAAACVSSGLHEHLLYQSPTLKATIHQYVAELQKNRVNEYKAAETEGRSPGQYWLGLETPKVVPTRVQ